MGTLTKPLRGPEIEWLRRNYHLRPVKETQRLLDEKFGKRSSRSTITRYRRVLGLRRAPNVGRFKPGHVPPNKGRKGEWPAGCEKGWFKKGSTSARTRPLYSERWRKHSSGPILEIKIPEPDPYTTASTRWMRKAVWIWKQQRGSVPAGHAIVQLDGDPANCEIENLISVPRGVLAIFNKWRGREPHRRRLSGEAYAAALMRAFLIYRANRRTKAQDPNP